MIESRKIVRATVEAVFSSSEKLRKHIDNLENENRPLRDEKERDLYFRTLTYSTLGLGNEIEFFYHKKDEGYILRTDLETGARWLAYQKEKIVKTPTWLRPNKDVKNEIYDVEIKYHWANLRGFLFTVYPMAIDRATRISKEQDEKQKTTGYQIK